MRAAVVIAAALTALGLIACGTGSSTSPLAPPAARPGANGGSNAGGEPGAAALSPAPTPTALPSSVGDIRLTTTGAEPGGIASATIHAPPSTSCSIVYTHPSGQISTATGLTPKFVAVTGSVSWSWSINASALPGTGTVTVTCGHTTVSAPITIGADTSP